MKRLRSLGLDLWLPIVIVLLWWVLSANSTSPYWPPLSRIMQTFFATWTSEHLWTDLLPSLGRFLLGFVLAAVLGIALGVVLGLVPTLRKIFDPLIDFMRSLPQPALIPILIILVGIDTEMKVFVIVLGAIWPILLNTIDGVRATEPEKLAVARIYGLDRMQWLTKVLLPSASPQIFVGARISLAISLILMVVSEMIASTNGLGYFILLSQQTFAIPEMWAGIIMLGIIGYLVNVIFLAVEHRILAWHRGWRAASTGAQVAPPKRKRRAAAGPAGELPRASVLETTTSN